MKKVDIKYISIKDFHLHRTAPTKRSECEEAICRCRINVYAVGVIYMKSKEASGRHFPSAKKVGVPRW